MRQHFAEHCLAHLVICRVVARRVIDRGGAPVEPLHLDIQPVAPLRAQRSGLVRQADNLVAGKQNELRLRCDPRHDAIDLRKGLLVRSSWNPGARVTVDDELVAAAPRQ
jgi:hypothetical protein